MKARISYRGLIAFLYIGGLIPLLVLMGLMVYGIQQSFMLSNTRNRLGNTVAATVQNTTVTENNLTRLAVSLGDNLRVLGADLFVKDVAGNPVPPALGTGPWLDAARHQQALDTHQGVYERLQTPDMDRMVYLAPVFDEQGNPLGTVEASLTLEFIKTELDTLRRWLVIVVSGATLVAVLLALVISEIARQPLEGLIVTAGQVAQGKLSTRAPLPNVSELHQLASTFNTMLDRIQSSLDAREQLTEEMRRFAADASHELRSPLSVFRNGVEILDKALQRGDSEQIEHVLSLLRNETESMTRLVTDLLLLARMEGGGENLAREMTLTPVEPLPLLEEVYERAGMLAQGQHIELVWPRSEVFSLHGDRELLRRALNNLVENAIHHTAPGKSIYLSLECDPHSCRFTVQDQGAGISSAELNHIFDRFYRGDSSRDRKRTGTGLGLAIVRAVVQAHHGEIAVDSRPGVGTSFTLTFPYQTLPALPGQETQME